MEEGRFLPSPACLAASFPARWAPPGLQASVGNLRPDARVEVRICYVSEVPLAGPDLRFVLPTAVAPRYDLQAPSAAKVPGGRPWLPAQSRLPSPSVLSHACPHPC